ncbi:MAG: DUF1854 domain-containing protein [Planctomycetaceae bacterium]|nr:DUF1854 domain-containing protein [Planctomycetaceae bacterium]
MSTGSATNHDFALERDAWGQLVLIQADGRRITGVEPARAFPISAPDGVLSICDSEGRELLCIEDPSKLQPEVRRALDEALTQRDFVPVVVRIESVAADADPSRWEVVTDRGPTEFLMEDSDNDVRRLGAHRILLVDSHGIRYLIPDTRRLDANSRRVLDRYL